MEKRRPKGKPAARRPLLDFAPREPDSLPLEVQRLTGDVAPFHREAHGHRFYELLYLTGGRGWHRVGLESARVGAGSLLLVAPGELHDSTGLTRVRGYLVLFESSALERHGQRFVDLPGELALLPFLRGGRAPAAFTVPPGQRVEWARRCEALVRELAGRELGRDAVARAELEVLLIHAARLVSARLGLARLAQRPLLSEVFQFIDARYARPISLVDVARAVGRSPAHLTTVVRRETGRSVYAWITERRMAEARRLLQETELEVADIAERVGYPDPSHFIRRFRANHRVTPLGFRRGGR